MPRHMSDERLRFYYQQPLEKMEAILLEMRLTQVINPDYRPTEAEAEQLERARGAIERLEADLQRALDAREALE